MKITKIHDLFFKELLSPREISMIVKSLAIKVKNDLPPKEIPIFIGILNSSFIFSADFIRYYSGNCEISFVKLSSYSNKKRNKKIKKLIGLNQNLTNRTVIILEDVIDTGNTLQ